MKKPLDYSEDAIDQHEIEINQKPSWIVPTILFMVSGVLVALLVWAF